MVRHLRAPDVEGIHRRPAVEPGVEGEPEIVARFLADALCLRGEVCTASHWIRDRADSAARFAGDELLGYRQLRTLPLAIEVAQDWMAMRVRADGDAVLADLLQLF